MATDEVTCLKHNETYPDGPGYCWQCDREGQEEYEQAIRADERAKVTAEIVAWLRAEAATARHEPECHDQCERCASATTEEADAGIIERGEHRPKPGQPKEGGK